VIEEPLMEDPILDYNILDSVHTSDRNLTQRDLARRVGRSGASVNFALRLLAAKGYIKITGSNPRKLMYHITPAGVLQKTILAYNFLKRQSALYEEVRNGLLKTVKSLRREGVDKAAVYGWTPFTETAILSLILEGVKVTAIYVEGKKEFDPWHRIPCRLISEFENDCQVLLLLEPLGEELADEISARKVECYPIA
jgi:DNA-binding Lrp family transcriptional regulator